MNKISTLTIKGIDIDLLYNNGFLAYAFEKDGKSYGQKLRIPSRSVLDIASVTFLLLTNALETYEHLNNESGTGSTA